MKIALLTDGIYPYVIGGMQKHSFYLVKYLARQGVFIDLYHINNSILDIDKLELFSAQEKRFITSYVLPFPEGDRLPGHYIRSSYKYSKLIFDLFNKNNSNIDFVYAKGFTAWKLIEEKKKGFKCAPVGVNFHGFEMFQKAPDLKSFLVQHLIFRTPVRYNVINADQVFSYGGKITEIITQITKRQDNIIEIPTGIEKDWLNKETKNVNLPLKFVFVGRYERRKGIKELTEAISELLPHYLFEFNFIGPIPKEKQLVSNGVHYHGSITESNKLRKLLIEQDVLVCPSHSEGMPNVIVEAMASRLAVIASDVGAVNKLVSDENGILIIPGNSKSIKEALTRMLKMKEEEILRLQQRSHEKIESYFLWEDIILITINALEKAISR